MSPEFSPETIFISYSRQDGRAFAESFERRLEREAGIHAWRDLKSMQGDDIRPQVLRAIEKVKHVVLILTRQGLASDWVRREWTHARLHGRMVSPVLADPSVRRNDLPAWIRRAEVFDIAEPERWAMLVQVLRGPGQIRRVPYMVGTLPDGFVERPTEYKKLKQAVLTARTDTAVAVTTALRGAGGYGKTTLVNQLCLDLDVRFEFSDGILRVEIGKERDDVTGLVLDLIERLDPERRRPGFQDLQTASDYLGELIGEARLLLVIDDVWREAQLRPFLKGGPNCVRLVTTRLPQVLPPSTKPITIDEMRAAEAVELISVNLPIAGDPAAQQRLRVLAKRLGCWAQMLSIANGWIVERILNGEPLAAAIARFEKRLEQRGLTAFDSGDEKARSRAIRACIEASLEDLRGDDGSRLRELAILPEDEYVPLEAVEALWAQTGGLDEDEVDELVRRFHTRSLLQNLDLGARTLRLHDNMIWYLGERIGPEGQRTAHAGMVQALHRACNGAWATLPHQSAWHIYGWRFLIRHLRGAGQDEQADQLVTSYEWIRAKLRARGVRELFASYLPESEDEGVRLIGRAVGLSISTLASYPRELPRQMFGRLGRINHLATAAVVARAREDEDFSPAPRWPGLTPPGAERLRLIGHESTVTSAVFSSDGTLILTASNDRTARVWDPVSGQEIRVLRGHGKAVESAVFSPDGTRILSASRDNTARIWDVSSGQASNVLRGHKSAVMRAVFSPDGTLILTASNDRTARLWDSVSGQEICVLRGHEYAVRRAVFSSDGTRILSASHDNTVRLWDVASGQESNVLHGHKSGVRSAVFSPDGTRILSASQDSTVRLWDAASGQEIHVLSGHGSAVMSAVFSPNGTRILSASGDWTARLWDAAVSQESYVLRGHKSAVMSAVFSPDGARILSASQDNTVRLWDAASGQESHVLRGHESGVMSAVFSPDGLRILSASHDNTARLWDVVSGQEIDILRGHEKTVASAVFSPDGTLILTASWDDTVCLWDATSGQQIRVLIGHEYGVRSAVFSPDGSRILSASQDKTARVWDTTTGKQIHILHGHKRLVETAVFSPDGAHILSASVDGTACLWDAATGQQIQALYGHESAVKTAMFSPNGTRILSASQDNTARLWDVASGQEIARVTLDAMVIALDVWNSTIALGDNLGRVHVIEAGKFLGERSPPHG